MRFERLFLLPKLGSLGVGVFWVLFWTALFVAGASSAKMSTVAPTNATFDEDLSTTFQKCWNSADWTLLFRNTQCHQAWTRVLAKQALVGIFDVEPIGKRHARVDANLNGALRVQYRSDSANKAIFKVCDAVEDYSYESWKAEVIAHAVDRVFAVNRVPAVVPRAIDVFSLRLPSSATTAARLRYNLNRVADVCQRRNSRFVGSVMGFVSLNLAERKNFHIHYTLEHTFDVKSIHQHNVEFARAVIFIFLTGQPHKMNHNLYTVVDPLTDQLFFLGLDNDRASFTPPEADDASERCKFADNVPACNRSVLHSQFSCSRFGVGHANCLTSTSGDSDLDFLTKISMQHLQSFIRTACIFPKTLASKIKRFAEEGKNESPSQLVENYVNEQTKEAQLDADPKIFSFQFWSPSVLDERVRFLSKTLHTCARTYGYSNVIFGGGDDEFQVKD
jgi:hypothetical protein